MWSGIQARFSRATNASNCIDWGHWVVFGSWLGWSAGVKATALVHRQDLKDGVCEVPLRLHAVSRAPRSETGSGSHQPPKAWDWKHVCDFCAFHWSKKS